jgi:Putative motility protein
MDIAGLSSSLAASKLSSQSNVLVARKVLDQQEQQGKDAVALIQKSSPDAGSSKLINIYA